MESIIPKNEKDMNTHLNGPERVRYLLVDTF